MPWHSHVGTRSINSFDTRGVLQPDTHCDVVDSGLYTVCTIQCMQFMHIAHMEKGGCAECLSATSLADAQMSCELMDL